jgi:hypothetical protein
MMLVVPDAREKLQIDTLLAMPIFDQKNNDER